MKDDPQWQGSALAALQRRSQQQARAERRSKYDPRGANPCMVSEEAFVQARKKMPWNFWVTLLAMLTAGFEKAHGDSTRWKNFRLLALDGTSINLENWRRLTDHFGTASCGKGRAGSSGSERMSRHDARVAEPGTRITD